MKFRHVRTLKAFLALILLTITFFHLLWNTKKSDRSENVLKLIAENEKKDWHDYEFIAYERSREGPGEQGKPFVLTEPHDIELNQELFNEEGLYVVVSDKISVNRSIPDYRPEKYSDN